MDDLPFKAEYAKSNRAGCKGCKQNIGKDSLRLARMVQVSIICWLSLGGSKTGLKIRFFCTKYDIVSC